MTRILAVIVGLLVSTSALAAPHPTTWRPPARFDHPIKGKMIIHYQSLFQVMWGGPCAGTCWAYTYIPARGATVCHSYIPVVGRKVNLEGQRELIRHERGHCNGWPANHPA